MTDREALLAAILADPADDTPRLVYADWLDENGQTDRANFIRVQVKLARRGYANIQCQFPVPGSPHCGQCDVCNLRRRERELLVARSYDWFLFGDLCAFQDGDRCTFQRWTENGNGTTLCGDFTPTRGFISHITCSWSDWHRHADAILAQQPIERVKLTTRPSYHEHETGARFDSDGPAGFDEGVRYWGPDTSKRPADVGKWLCEKKWPRIEFELAPVNLTAEH